MQSFLSAPLLRQFRRYQPLLHELVTRDLKVKYRRSFLGCLWSLLNPLLMMTIMTVVFSYMFRFSTPNYPLYLICGQTLWAFFSESTNMAMTSVIYNGPLIRKVCIPKYIFPVSRVLSCFVTMSFSLTAILIVMLVTRVPLSVYLLLAPVPLVLLLVFCTGVGMVLSALAVGDFRFQEKCPMKKSYEALNVDVVKFEAQDVITASGVTGSSIPGKNPNS